MADVFHLPLQHVKKKQLDVVPPHVALYTIVLLFCLAAQVPPAFGTAFSRCKADQFTCKDGSCILQEKMCDGRLDCSDNSDELDCDFKMCRKPNWFQCALPQGPCLSSDLICNGIDNCPGGEDELDCVGSKRGSTAPTTRFGSADVGAGGWYSTPRNCTAYEYTCQTDKSCIPLDFMCDGKSDCHDGSDEVAGCLKAEANCTGFFCSNRKCLESKKWVCDGIDDCGDGSDERNCTLKCNTESGKFLCHDNITCLEISQVCNNQTNCPDASDESQRCLSLTHNCSTMICPPAAKCQMLPDADPICMCPTGYRHSDLQNVCMDINECNETYGICSQGCDNIPGGYRCTCDVGYALNPADNRTCVAFGEEALLLYTTQVTVMGVHLRSNRVFTVAGNLTKVIGVSYDGDYIYWTNIQNEAESIVKAKSDGTQQEILLTSGLDAPEDLAVDWLTGNIYFSDNVMHHIAVCSNDGHICSVLVSIDVHQPRGVALWPQRGQMFWTDWGTKPMISRASMDGSNSMAIVTEDIHWPNGVALDMHNNRVYWVDAKLATMESVRPDGTDRRVVLNEILKHPYGLAIFEDSIYWSDWGTKSVHTCNKFTGKNHKVIAKDRTIYAVHIYHASKQPKTAHACMNSRCSHLCLLAENNSSTCACPDGMQLGMDQMRCMKTTKKQRLFIAIKNTILEMEHTTFGRHIISQTHQLPMYINEMAYNNVNGTIIIADNIQRSISEYDLITSNITTLVHGNLGNVTGIAFDHLSHNVYWTDSDRSVVEVFSLRTRQRAIVKFFSGVEAPVGIAIIPDDGIMFIVLRSRRHVHIDQGQLNGRGEHTHVFDDELGDDDIKFAPDYETQTLYWSDSDLGRISFTDYRNLQAYTFRSRLKRPSYMAIVGDDLFWSCLKTSAIYWTHKSNLGPMKRFEIEVSKDAYTHMMPKRIPLLASTPAMIVDHPCQHANGGCSHICVTLGKFAGACLCPAGMVFKDATNQSCIEALDCEFRCRSGECLTQSRRCNGRKDCPDASDEEDCDVKDAHHAKVVCSIGEFMCHNAEQCIRNKNRCDGVKDCHDGSDEMHCEKFDQAKKCHSHQHACDNGNCVDFSVMCDGADDCGDNSDESNCKVTKSSSEGGSRPVCDKNMFQCNTGTCIAKSWECDGKIDCTDGSDEHEKCALKDCPANMHKCLMGQCIDARLVCDDHNDCGDLSDELNCDYATGHKRNMSCGDEQHPMYQCPSDGSVCLDLAAKCNGTAECPRGEDEADCGAMCSIYEFQCKTSKECIRDEFRCDHEKDCADGSDELNCERKASKGANGTTPTAGTNERPCEANMFDCKDGQCVDMTRVCNGFLDCETGADEGPLCHTACQSTSSKPVCEHKCRPTPSGAVCSCFTGFHLDSDERSCLDINECQEIDPCAQICENTLGSYRCSCYPDFMLRTDKTTCKSIESQSALMFSTYDEVRLMTDQPIVLRVAWSANDSKIAGLDLNVHNRSAYFTTEGEDILYKVELGNNTIKAGLMVEMPSKVAVDWIADTVYVISRSSRHYQIKVCSFEAKMCGRIIQANPREIIKSLTVDAFTRKLFYVTIRTQSFNQPLSQISVSDLDGQKREVLLTKKGGYITAIAADPYKQQLYFTDLHTKTLQAVSYKVGGSRIPTTLIQKGHVVMHPSGLTIYENQAFIVNIGAKEAVRCQLYGSRICKAFNLNILNAEDIVIDGPSRQPLKTNPCAMAKCSGMCLQSEYGYECMCGDVIVAEHVSCPKETSNGITSSALFTPDLLLQNEEESAPHSHTATAVTLGLLILALLIAGVGYLYYHRMNQGHRDFNINLHFQNPLSSVAAVNGSIGKTSTLYSSGGGSTTTTDSSDGTTVGSFEERKHGKTQFRLPTFHRLLRGSSTLTASEILLETSQPRKVRPLGANERLHGHMVEEEFAHDAPGSDGHFDDDARARLVA